jgi:hypothetical protein
MGYKTDCNCTPIIQRSPAGGRTVNPIALASFCSYSDRPHAIVIACDDSAVFSWKELTGDYSRLAMRRRRGQLPNAACAAAALACCLTLLPPTGGAEPNTPIANLAPDNMTGWLKGPGDEFIQPESGPGPIKSDPALPYVSNAVARQETVKIADLTNPILQPWVREQMRKANEEVLAGKVGFTARTRCWPHGVPGFLLYPVHPIFFIQTPKQVAMTWGQDFQLRRVYLNAPHSANPKPSWYGESVGHYENGDTHNQSTERLTFTRRHAMTVEQLSDLRISMSVKKSIDFPNDSI